jgi:hypothetical protein
MNEEMDTIVERWKIEEKALNEEIERLRQSWDDKLTQWKNMYHELEQQCERLKKMLKGRCTDAEWRENNWT